MVIIFNLVYFFYKKNNQTEFIFFKKTRNQTKTGSNRTVSVRFGFLDKNRFDSVFSSFFRFGFGSVFSVSAYKTETKPIGFFKILIGLIGFFSQFGFFGYFFSGFLGLICFLVFLLTPTTRGVAQLIRSWVCSTEVTSSSVTNLRAIESLHGR